MALPLASQPASYQAIKSLAAPQASPMNWLEATDQPAATPSRRTGQGPRNLACRQGCNIVFGLGQVEFNERASV